MKKIVKSLSVRLSIEEIDQRRDALVEVIRSKDAVADELADAEEGFKALSKKLKADIVRAEREESRIAAELHSGLTTAEVECFERGNYYNNTVEWVRCDTLEVVGHRDMTEDERKNPALPLDQVEEVEGEPVSEQDYDQSLNGATVTAIARISPAKPVRRTRGTV